MRFLAAAVAAAALAPAASAAGPTVLSVSEARRHPVVTWTLPPRVTALMISIATSPQRDGDGTFVDEHEILVDPLDDAAAEWRAEEPLAAGTYYVLVSGWDHSCADGRGTCGVVFSDVRELVVRNPPPTVDDLKWTLKRGQRGYHAAARLRICDDVGGPIAVRIRERRTLGGRLRASNEHVDDVGLRARGCRVVTLRWAVGSRFLARGPYNIRITVRDDEGATGNTVEFTWVD